MMRLALLSLLVACGSSKPAGSSAPPPPAKLDPNAPLPVSCRVSEDCALVQACCGCTAAGKQIAIRADSVAAFEASRGERCRDQMCAQAISSDPSCQAEAVCGQNDRCNVAPHLQSE